jgi:hypothetical protein
MHSEIHTYKENRILTDIRSNLYKKICKGEGGLNQWKYIIGIKSMDASRNKIKLTKRNIQYLEQVVHYLNGEGKSDIETFGITLYNYDDLIELIRNSKTVKQLKNDEFRMILRNKKRLVNFLCR